MNTTASPESGPRLSALDGALNRVTNAPADALSLAGCLSVATAEHVSMAAGVRVKGPTILPVSEALTPRSIGEAGRHAAELSLDAADREALEGLPLDKPCFVSVTLAAEAKLNAADESIVDKLQYVEEVCTRPYETLTTIESVEPMRRARALAPRSLDLLARSPQDWERMTLNGPRPRAILTRLPEVVFDIYENRVALTLLDYLRTYLARRIRQVTRAQSVAASIDLSHVSRFVRERLSHQAADLFELSELQAHAANALSVLEQLDRRVRGLRESPLAKALRNPRRETRLRPTNIFRSDARYRRVAELWRAVRRVDAAVLRPQALFERDLDAARDFDAFVRALVADAAPRAAAQATALDTPGVHGVRAGSNTLRVVTIPARWAATEATAAHVLDTLQGITCESPTLLVFLGEWESLLPLAPDSARRRLLAWGAEFERLHSGGAPCAIPASPFSLRSRETVSAALRAALLPQLWAAYPPTWTPGPDLVTAGLARDPVELPTCTQVNALESRVRALRPQPRWTQRQRQSLRDAQERAGLELGEARSALNALATCPRCSGAGDFEARSGHTFRSTCRTCSATWGLQLAAGTGERTAFIAPSLDEGRAIALNTPNADAATWIERCGQDLLARPSLSADDSWRFTPPATAAHAPR